MAKQQNEGKRGCLDSYVEQLPWKLELLILGLLCMKDINAYFNKATLFGDLYYYSLAFPIALEKLVLKVGCSHHKSKKDVN